MLFISWGLWWTSIVLSWFFVGRMWCGVCPFPGIGAFYVAWIFYSQEFEGMVPKKNFFVIVGLIILVSILYFSFI
ncbi:hypothetical protein, partial [Thermodesulfatator indicus]